MPSFGRALPYWAYLPERLLLPPSLRDWDSKDGHRVYNLVPCLLKMPPHASRASLCNSKTTTQPRKVLTGATVHADMYLPHCKAVHISGNLGHVPPPCYENLTYPQQVNTMPSPSGQFFQDRGRRTLSYTERNSLESTDCIDSISGLVAGLSLILGGAAPTNLITRMWCP